MAVAAVMPIARRMAPLTAGHAVVDFSQGALPALIPLLKGELDLSYTQAGALILALTVTSSVTQPFFGLLADRVGLLWVLPASVIASGAGIACATVAPSYPLLFGSILLAGLGIAAYHPEGARVAAAISGSARASGMSLFSVGGNLGVAVGPFAAGLIADQLGLGGGPLLAIPAAAIALVLVIALPSMRGHLDREAATRGELVGEDRPWALVLLLAGVTFRGYVFFGLLGFVGLYEHDVRGHPASRGAVLLTLLLACGACGTLIMGRVADRFGLRRSMIASFTAVGPLIAIYVLDDGVVGIVAIGLAGMTLISTFSVSVVLSQLYLPSRASTAAGLGFGFAIGVGGILAVVVGWIADAFSLETALLSCAAVAVVGAAVTALMPDERARVA